MLITILRKPMCIELKVIYSKTNNKNMKSPKKFDATKFLRVCEILVAFSEYMNFKTAKLKSTLFQCGRYARMVLCANTHE